MEILLERNSQIKVIAEHRNTSSDQDEILYRESSNQMKISGARIYDQ